MPAVYFVMGNDKQGQRIVRGPYDRKHADEVRKNLRAIGYNVRVVSGKAP